MVLIKIHFDAIYIYTSTERKLTTRTAFQTDKAEERKCLIVYTQLEI